MFVTAVSDSHLYCVCAELCLTLCDTMDCSLPGSSVNGILQARILEWLLFPSPGDLSGFCIVSHLVGHKRFSKENTFSSAENGV